MSFLSTSLASDLIPGFSSLSGEAQTHLINSACSEIETYCRRKFSVTSYDEIYNGTRNGIIFTKNYPIVSISKISYGLDTAFSVDVIKYGNVNRSSITINTQSGQATPYSVTLYREMDAGPSTSTLLLSQYLLIDELVNAINLDGSHIATIVPKYAKWQSSYIRPVKSTYDTYDNTADILIFKEDAHNYLIEKDIGKIVLDNVSLGIIGSASGFFGQSTLYPLDSKSFQDLRITYTAGFETVPYEVVDCAIELTRIGFDNRRASGYFTREKMFDYEYEIKPETLIIAKDKIKSRLSHYVCRHRDL